MEEIERNNDSNNSIRIHDFTVIDRSMQVLSVLHAPIARSGHSIFPPNQVSVGSGSQLDQKHPNSSVAG
jgi:hypothetical protein